MRKFLTLLRKTKCFCNLIYLLHTISCKFRLMNKLITKIKYNKKPMGRFWIFPHLIFLKIYLSYYTCIKCISVLHTISIINSLVFNFICFSSIFFRFDFTTFLFRAKFCVFLQYTKPIIRSKIKWCSNILNFDYFDWTF